MTEKTASVFDTLNLCDDNYITLEHCDPDNWTADFTKFCEEFDLHDVELVQSCITNQRSQIHH